MPTFNLMQHADQCRFAASEIRTLNRPHLDDAARAEVLTIAAIVERRGAAAVVERLDPARLRIALVDIVDAVELLYGAPAAAPAELQAVEVAP